MVKFDVEGRVDVDATSDGVDVLLDRLDGDDGEAEGRHVDRTRSDVGSDVHERVPEHASLVHRSRHPQHELHDPTCGQVSSGSHKVDDAHAIL